MKIKILFLIILISSIAGLFSKEPAEIIAKTESSDWAENRGTFVSGGVTYDVYEKKVHGDDSGAHANKWSYTAFVARTTIMKGVFKIEEFFSFMIKNNMMKADNYITNIDLGNEIWYGKGIVKMRKYEIIVY